MSTCLISGKFDLIFHTQTPFLIISHLYAHYTFRFPEVLMEKLKVMFNRSSSPYFISYQNPKKIIDRYGFHVELICKVPTAMHGSSECHMCFIYRRIASDGEAINCTKIVDGAACDPMFEKSWRDRNKSLEERCEELERELGYYFNRIEKRERSPPERFTFSEPIRHIKKKTCRKKEKGSTSYKQRIKR